MTNILYIFVTLPIGGAEEHLLTVLKNIDKSRYAPIVCCIREKGVIGEEIENLGVAVISLGRKSKFFDLRVVRDLLKIIRGENIQLIHAHLYHANMYARIAAFFSKIPVVITEHNIYSRYKFKRRIINRLLAKKTEVIIAVSETVKTYIAKRDWLRSSLIEVVYNGIDISKFSTPLSKAEARKKIGISTDCTLLGTVGRLVKQKGHIYLINAMNRIKDVVPDIKLLIVGSGSLESYLRETVSAQHLNEYVVFLGSRRDIPDILKALDIFVLPSLWEGLPIAILEAMGASLPVIATRVGSIAEIISDGADGIVVPPCDEDALAGAILDLSSNRQKAELLSDRAKKTVFEKFNSVGMTRKIEAIYQTVLRPR